VRSLASVLETLQEIGSNAASEEVREHYASLKAAVVECDQEKIKMLIDHPPSQDRDQAYLKGLSELNEHFRPAIETIEAKKYTLDKAITSGAAADVHEVIQQGGITLLNEMNVLFLRQVLETNDPEKIMAIVSYLSKTQLEQPLDEEGNTILHYAVLRDYHSVTEEVVRKGVDVNLKRKDGATALHLAVDHSPYYISTLLINKNADVNAKQKLKEGIEVTALSRAIFYDNAPLVFALLKSGAVVDYYSLQMAKEKSESAPDIYEAVAAPVEKRKAAIIEKGPIWSKLDEADRPENPILKIILSHIYTENSQYDQQIAQRFKGIMESDNATLKPLLNIVAYAMKGAHRPDHHPLQIIVGEENTVESLVKREHTVGYYDKDNTIYCAGLSSAEKCVGGILHESQHFTDQLVFGDTDKPYMTEGNFRQMQEDVSKRTPTLPEQTPEEKLIKSSFSTALSEHYEKNERDAEFLVKVPEVIGILGVEKGIHWLQEQQPGLLGYYQHRHARTCNAYIVEHGVKEALLGNPHRFYSLPVGEKEGGKKEEKEKEKSESPQDRPPSPGHD